MDNPLLFVQTAWQLQILAYIQVVLYTFFLYEYVYLLPTEIERIWLAKWDGRRWITSSLYIICRYTTFFDFSTIIYDMSAPAVGGIFCHFLNLAATWVTLIGLECAQLTFALRAYALWQDYRLVKHFLIFVAFSMFGAGVAINTILLTHNTTAENTTNGTSFMSNCSVSLKNQPELSMWGILAVLVYETILMVMAIGAKIKFKYNLGANSLTRKVYEDALYYFTLNLLISMTSIVLYERCPGPLKQLTGVFSSVASRCLSCRVVLRLRKPNQEDSRSGITTEVANNPIQFGRNPHLCNDSETFLGSIFRRSQRRITHGNEPSSGRERFSGRNSEIST
ncbi:hypothetical protein P691DRAFT_779434 [Macrolepiota fuliginosa MF-IS2]|uniref:DUF6533 domain-containing protein n=1 Tax=Macrolepiota fuliginosa MF-IS2 TaxID=1400762 RepID=A0A9P5X0S9_9AGAR|nr:hypothetical protein P691DRAFT_779434 [Macrolepiota fuliginosa MF-IS2]